MRSCFGELGASQNILAHQFEIERPISKLVGIVIDTVNFREGNRLFRCFITRFSTVKAKVSKMWPNYLNDFDQGLFVAKDKVMWHHDRIEKN